MTIDQEPDRCDECGGGLKPGDKVLVAPGVAKAFCCKACAHLHLEDEDAELRVALKVAFAQTSESRVHLAKQGD